MADTPEFTHNFLLRKERERRAWSQQDVADKVGTTPVNVSRWERGITQPGPYFRQKLGAIFEKSPQQLGLTHEPGMPSTAEPTSTLDLASSEVTEPVLLWNIPYRRNIFFTGREDILTYLRDTLLSTAQTVALAQPQAISGLGGIGKTQTAIEYAYRYRDSYQTVLWARAESRDLLISDYLVMASLLKLPKHNEQDQNKAVKAVIHWLDMHDGWLLLLDNADNLQVIEEFIPSAGKGHVLLTTRMHSTGTTAQRIEIEKMELDG